MTASWNSRRIRGGLNYPRHASLAIRIQICLYTNPQLYTPIENGCIPLELVLRIVPKDRYEKLLTHHLMPSPLS